MDLETLKKSASKMTDEELLEVLHGMRANRRKKVEVKPKAKAKKSADPTAKALKGLKGLDKAGKAALLEMLKEMT